jgi:hypothetical protein
MNGKNFIKRLAVASAAALLVFSGLVTENFGGTSVKTFDFGPGGDNPTLRSHARSFLAPQAVALTLKINYRTAGEAPVPVMIEVEDAGSRLITTQEIIAEKAAKRLLINISAAENTSHACDKGWQVRVKSKNGQPPPARIFGDITFSFIDPPVEKIALGERAFGLKKGGQASFPIGTSETFRHSGIINIKSSWAHNPLAPAQALKFELLRPDRSVAKSLTGYGTNSNGQPKIDFDYRLVIADTKQNGVWRLRITNGTEQEILEVNPSVNFTRRCFE